MYLARGMDDKFYLAAELHIIITQGSPEYGPRATSGPLRPFIWPAELSLKKQIKLGKLTILTLLYSDIRACQFEGEINFPPIFKVSGPKNMYLGVRNSNL